MDQLSGSGAGRWLGHDFPAEGPDSSGLWVGRHAADDDLLDVEQLDLVPRQYFEQRRRDARPVGAGDRDQQR